MKCTTDLQTITIVDSILHWTAYFNDNECSFANCSSA